MATYDPHNNLAYSTVLTPPSPAASGTTVVLQSGHGARFSDPATVGSYNCAVGPAGAYPDPLNTEIVRVTAKSGDTLTITRAQEGTAARTILTNDVFTAAITAKALTDLETNKFDRDGGILTGLGGGTYPGFSAGRFFYDTDNDCPSFMGSNSNVTLNIGQEHFIRAKNNSASGISNGDVVYITGDDTGVPTIAAAKADNANTAIVAGIATQSISIGSTGMVTVAGIVHGLGTSGFTSGARLYLSATTAGAYTSTMPTGPNVWQVRVGTIIRSIISPQGSLMVGVGEPKRDTAWERGLPSWSYGADGIAPFGPCSPGLGLYNAKGSNMRKIHAAIMRAMAGGTGKIHIVVIGDSIGTGYNGTAAVDNNSYPQRLGRSLAAHLGIPRAGGFHAAISALSISSDRWTLNAGTVNGTNFAGALQVNASSAVTFTTEIPCTGFDLLISDNSTTGGTYQIDGGTGVTMTTTATATVRKITVSGLSYGIHTVRFNAPAGGAIYLIGVRPTYAYGVEIHNLSFGGGRAASGTGAVNWTDTVTAGQLYANHKLGFDALGITPDLVICELGGNDIYQGDTPANAISGINTIRGWYPTADFMMIGFNAINGTNMTNWNDYSARKYALADTLDCPLLDLRTKMGDYTEAQANGLLGSDNLHLSDSMNIETGRLVANGIIMSAGGLTDLDPEKSGLVARTRGGIEGVAVADGTAGTVTLRLSVANIFTLTPTAAVTTLTITDVPATAKGVTVRLIVSQGATPFAIATPTGGIFFGATTPTPVASKKTIYDYETVDGGTTWLCSGTNQV